MEPLVQHNTNVDTNNNQKKNKKKKNKKKKGSENINPAPERNVTMSTQSTINGEGKAERKNGQASNAANKKEIKFADDVEDGPAMHHNLDEPASEEAIPKLNFGDATGENEPNSAAVDEDDSEDEGIEDYKIGGYHPVHIGEVLLDRYVVIQKLGWGHFSTVWLCKDFRFETYVAIKIQKSAPHYLEAAYDEVEILQKVARMANDPEWMRSLKEYNKDEKKTQFTKDDCHVVQLLNCFIYQGPYGNHFCMVFEIMGVNLLEIIKRYNYKGVPMHLCRILAKQILIALDYLHRICGIIHTDLKPENILICLTKEETRQVVECGQLSKSKQYNERIREYQAKHGIVMDELQEDKEPEPQKKAEPKENEKEDDDEEDDDDNAPKQKSGKNARKKRNRQKKKQKEQEAKLAAEGKNAQKKEANKKDQTSGQPETTSSGLPPEITDKGSLRGPKIDENVRVKIVDLGNACWTHHHFTSKIQTRQYRSPEVILGLHYAPSADIWSFACTIFEMLTGDFLFEPRKGQHFSKNDDHFAQIIELLRVFPKKYVSAGKNFKKFFDRFGSLRRIQGFHHWSLKNVLTDKYQMKEHEAEAFASFIMPMLEYYPLKRVSAQRCLRNRWLKMPRKPEYKMSEQEYADFMQAKQNQNQNPAGSPYDAQSDNHIYVDSEDMDADDDEDLENDDDWSDEEWGPHDNYGYKHYLNKSYDNGVYTGYADGIKIGELDQEPNFQFQSKKRKH